jgi:hypothetical protein
MASDERCVPGAQLMESMRAVGYSVETAIADIIDNSVSAGATTIEIDYSMDVEMPFLSILDDGTGMSPSSAREAMRLAGVGANSVREDNDLGRFGLGLKTASLSQCRRLTVLTKDANATTGLVWDLDHIARTNDWSLIVLNEREMREVLGFDRLESRESGTLIVWNGFDRISAQTEMVSKEFDDEMVRTRDHLALIFHQYLNGDHPYRKVRMLLNWNEIEGFDPFLSNSKKTQVSPIERISVVDTSITVQSYTLPYLNEMSEKQRRLAQIPGQMRDSQGFYIYRGGRLVIWGTWFRLLPKSEGGKLARVKVEIPNSLDHLWSLDIKKSSAIPPVAVRDQLRRLADTLAAPSRQVVDYRGRKVKDDEEIVRIWDVIVDRDTFRYEINRDHPALKQLERSVEPSELRSLENALELIETYFPTQDLANRHSKDQIPAVSANDEEELIRTNLLAMRDAGGNALGPINEFVEMLVGSEPWNRYRRTPEVLINWIVESSSYENGMKNA